MRMFIMKISILNSFRQICRKNKRQHLIMSIKRKSTCGQENHRYPRKISILYNSLTAFPNMFLLD